MKLLLVFAGVLLLSNIHAQEDFSLDWDISSIFDESFIYDDDEGSLWDDFFPEETRSAAAEVTIIQMINRRGLTFDASYGFSIGVSPGWHYPPWHYYDYDEDEAEEENPFSWIPVARMRASFVLDAQISRVFGIKTNILFTIPDFAYQLGDFFFDYNFFDVVFMRGGKYNQKWGISPNYDFTNLLARVPETGNVHDSFILKVDIPVGVGGFQFLALTRANLMGSAELNRTNIGLGSKYNLALRRIDLDTGAFYHHGLPFRGFLSLKTTLGNTEVYSEGLAAVDDETSVISGSANFGFAHEFFDKKLSVNGEFFYNAEDKAFWFSSKTEFLEAKTSAFIEGLNIALNLVYRFDGKGNPRFFLQTLYAVQENTAQLIPGFRITPLSHIELYMAVPMALGSREGYYYRNTVTHDRDNNPRRFAIILLASLSGSMRFAHFF